MLIRVTRLGSLAAYIFLLSSAAQAESLKVTVAQSVATDLPDATARIIRALKSTGYEIELLVLPGNRALLQASSGEVAIDIYRQAAAIAHVPNLVVLEPPVDEVAFGMIVSKHKPELCNVKQAQFSEMSVAGRLGIKLYEDYYYPLFAKAITLADFQQVFKVVAKQRVDVSFLTEDVYRNAPQEIQDEVIFCKAHRKTFSINSFIHEDYLWARDKIEAAYRKEFGG